MMEVVEYAGWKNCIKLANDEIELVATTDVGPRIVYLGFKGGQNFMGHIENEIGKSGGDEWRLYGGHRFWHAPEQIPRTYAPDNTPIEYDWKGNTLTLKQPMEHSTGIEKQVEIRLETDKNVVHVKHRITNHNLWEVELAPWALTVMAAEGRAIIPQEKYIPHSERLVPARPLVLWHYTDMSDPRWIWGRKYIQLKQDKSAENQQKAGVLNTHGWAAYALKDELFIKKLPYDPSATYPDFGCNTEVYTDPVFLELESLGPLTRVAPEGTIEHDEMWFISKTKVGSDEAEIDSKVLALVNILQID